MDSGILGFVTHVSRLLGVAPYMRTAKDGVSNIIFVFGVIVVTCVSVNSVFFEIDKIMSLNDVQSKKYIMLDIISVFGSCLLASITIIGAWTSRKRIIHMVQSLRKLDEIYEIIRSNGFKLQVDKKIHYILWIYLSGVFALRVSDYILKKPSDYSSTIVAISIAILCVWIDLCFLQVICFSEKVLITLAAINENLHQLSTERNEEEEGKFINNKVIKPKIAFVHSRNDTENIEDLHNDTNWRRLRSQTVASKKSIDYAIRGLSHCYMTICQIVRDTTSINGLLLIMILLDHMLYMEIITYQIILLMSGENSLGFEIVFLTYHDLADVFGLFLLVDCFHRTHSEMEHTELLVRCLKYENDLSTASNNELDLFQRISVLQSTKFSPLNMCTLDRSLLVKVFGILISYLVIIITYGPEIDKEANKEMFDRIRLTRNF